jgi:hypothetical protein
MRKLRTWLTLAAVVLPLLNAVRRRRKSRRSRLQRLMAAANEQVSDARDTLDTVGGATQERAGSVAQAIAGLAGAALAATPVAAGRRRQESGADAPDRQEDWRRYGEVFPR